MMEHRIRINWAYEEMGCSCGAPGLDDPDALTDHIAAVEAGGAGMTESDESDTLRLFTADEVVEIANETSDSFGNLYRLDFIDRIRHEACVTSPEKADA